MDEDARQELIAQALLQEARHHAKRGWQNMPFGIVLMTVGATIVVVSMQTDVLPVLALAFGFGLVPLGLVVVIKSIAAIAEEKRLAREQRLPQARLRE